MATKIKAAQMAVNAGEMAIIANGNNKKILKQIFDGEEVGTLFLPSRKKVEGRKRWFAFTLQAKGKLIIDNGAKDALHEKGKSLLSAGITGVEGVFKAGDLVSIIDAHGNEIARGLTNFSDKEIRKIKGKKTNQVTDILGYKPYDEIVHRDNMLIS
jgi:glutamate 5-kinase